MTNYKSIMLMVKTLLLLTMISIQGMTTTAAGQDNRTTTKTFKVCAFNVDGLPQKFGLINVNPDGQGEEGAQGIGQYIAQSDIDIYALSEDFNYHNVIKSQLDDRFKVGTWRGGINMNQYKLNIQFDTDGLDIVCKNPISFDDDSESWTRWEKSYGRLDHGNDELIRKGYRYYLIELGDGFKIDLYMMHMDADTGDKDNEARASQWSQLAKAILADQNHRPVVVLGDTNSRYTRDDIRGLFINPIEESGKFTVKDAWVELCKDGNYPTLGADPLMVNELGYREGEIVDKVFYLNPTQGMTSIDALEFQVDEQLDKSDHKPVIVSMKVEREDITNGIKDVKENPSTAGALENASSPVAEIYGLNGVRRSQMTSGINLVKMNDGSVRKVIRK